MASLGNLAESGVVALAVSEAAGAVVEPALEPARQEAEKATKARIHDLSALAQSVAQALLTLDDVTDHAARNGYDKDELALSVQLALRAPGVPEALTLYRRRAIDGVTDADAVAQLYHAFAKAQIEYQYWPRLLQTAQVPHDPAVIALGIVRSIYRDPGFLPVTLDTEGSTVPAYTPTTLDPLEQAAASGVDAEHLRVLVGNTGRPSPPHETAQAVFRNLVNRQTFNLSILEGDIRPEYADLLFEVSRQILTAHDYVELNLRGWIDPAAMYAGTALHGMSKADTDLMLKVIGRPINVHQVTTGLARGGTYGGVYEGVPEPYLTAIRESNIRPEWGNLAYANRYTLPGYFVIRAMLQTGTITEAEGAQLFKEEGWPPDLAEKAAAALAPAGSTGKRLTQSQIHAAFKAGTMTEVDALARLEQDGYSQADAQLLVNTWKA
jgi:hypothetical protein